MVEITCVSLFVTVMKAQSGISIGRSETKSGSASTVTRTEQPVGKLLRLRRR